MESFYSTLYWVYMIELSSGYDSLVQSKVIISVYLNLRLLRTKLQFTNGTAILETAIQSKGTSSPTREPFAQ